MLRRGTSIDWQCYQDIRFVPAIDFISSAYLVTGFSTRDDGTKTPLDDRRAEQIELLYLVARNPERSLVSYDGVEYNKLFNKPHLTGLEIM